MTEDPRRTRLAAIEEEKTALREQMAEQAEDWKRAAAEWAKDQWQRETQRSVEASPEKVKELALTDALGTLKGNIDALIKQAPAKVSALFDESPLWSHLTGTVFETEGSPKRPDDHYYESYSSGLPKQFDQPLRLLKGELLPLLNDTGLLDSHMREAVAQTGNVRRYPFAMDPPTSLVESLSVYSSTYKAFVALDVERTTLEGELAREEATHLWESA